MLNIYVTRHGQDEDNARGLLNGHRNTKLTAKGILQAHEIAKEIKEAGICFDHIYSSPLDRAFMTAEIIAKTLGNTKPEKLEDLIERDYGAMTGEKISQIRELCSPYLLQADPILYFLRAKNSESFPMAQRRAKKLLTKLKKKHTNGNILLVTHGDMGKMLYAAYYNIHWKDVLRMFHFGNSELLLMSPGSKPQDAHVFRIEQHNL
jgi:broad specificity phosphatase PhoE